jgi:hypothetical protein
MDCIVDAVEDVAVGAVKIEHIPSVVDVLLMPHSYYCMNKGDN